MTEQHAYGCPCDRCQTPDVYMDRLEARVANLRAALRRLSTAIQTDVALSELADAVDAADALLESK